MKKIFFKSVFTALTVFASCSCNKTVNTAPTQDVNQDAAACCAELNLHISTLPTKTTVRSDAMDCAIDTIAILVFDENETLENIVFSGIDSNGKITSSIRTTQGLKTILAFANGSTQFRDKLRSINELYGLEELSSSLVDDNTSSSFLMTGREDEVNVNKASVDLTMEVTRLVARIEIKKIIYDLTAETDRQTAGEPFRLNAIYLTNVPGTYNFNDYASEQWLNKMKRDDDKSSIYADTDINHDFIAGKTYDTPHYFYSYPNDNTNAGCTETDWCPRPTRLVIECLVGAGKVPCYYSFEMPDARQNSSVKKLSSNKTYTINSCTITRRGNYNPWEEVPLGSISVSITVKDWETGASYEYTI